MRKNVQKLRTSMKLKVYGWWWNWEAVSIKSNHTIYSGATFSVKEGRKRRGKKAEIVAPAGKEKQCM